MPPDPGIEQWSQFGLAGLVIFALFTTLFVIVRWLIAHIDKQAVEHRSERAEWRSSSEKTNENITRTVDELSKSIRDIANK